MHSKRKTRRETTHNTTQYAHHLRRVLTPAERLLWSRLRRKILGCHFRRQAPMGKYILDFYCVKAKLVIEVDGDIHAERLSQDAVKTSWLQFQKHIRVLRVTNREVFENIEGVMNTILRELAFLPSPPPFPPPLAWLPGED